MNSSPLRIEAPAGIIGAGISSQQNRAPEWGFIDKEGKAVIAPQFDFAESFSGGLARVKIGRNEGYIDATGKFVWNPTK